MADNNLLEVSILNINDNEFGIKDATSRASIDIITESIISNNNTISSRINDLNSRLSVLEGNQGSQGSQGSQGTLSGQFVLSEDYAISDGTGNALDLVSGDTGDEAFGKIEKKTNDNKTAISALDTRIQLLEGSQGSQGSQGSVLLSLSNNYSPSSDTNEDLELEAGDTYEEAFGKLEKSLSDTEFVISRSILDLNDRLEFLEDYGPQGTQGTPVGSQGSQGDIGNQGYQGTQGDIGVQGYQGTQGNNGENGAQGNQGEAGPQGTAGENGAQGYQGEVGPQGTQGDIGNQGYQGEVGPQGTAGENGAQGYQGEIGPQGDIGNQGYQGEIGPQGPQGTFDASLELSNEYAPALGSGSSLTLAAGDSYEESFGKIEKKINDSNIIVYTSIVDLDTRLKDIETNGVQGSQGSSGGAQGAQGAQGKQGKQGAKGNDGNNGAQGYQGTQGKQGAKGNNGDNGAQGNQGKQGPAGPSILPSITSSDNGKILMVVNGAWTLVSPSTLYSGSGIPNNAQGNNGDLYAQTE